MKLPQCTLLLLVAALTSSASLAHKRWLLPTDFTLSEAETVTVDFTASNNIFYVDKGMPLAMVQVKTPTGETPPLLNPQEGERRSSFDINVDETGTYTVAAGGAPMYFVAYNLPGQSERVHKRGTLAGLKAELPAAATDVEFSESHGLIETFVTLGSQSTPTTDSKTAGLHLQLLESHPNALYTDEPAHFGFRLNGKPAAGLAVEVLADGSRYRDTQDAQTYVTNAEGVVEISWPAAGRYLIEASLEQDVPEGEIAKRYYSYFLTVEVLAP